MNAQRQIRGAVGQIGQRAGHLLEPPDAAQIGQCRPQRYPPLGAAQGGAKVIGGQRFEAGGFAGDDILMRQGLGQPVGLVQNQSGQIGAAPGSAPDQVTQTRIGNAGGLKGGLSAG